MNEIAINTTAFGVVLSMIGYEIGILLKNKFKSPIFNPLLISIAFIIGFLLIFKIDYENYNASAKYITYLLTPTTVCLAIPLYLQLDLLKKYPLAIMLGIFSGIITCLFGVYIMSLLFGLNHAEYVTLLPKSITTAIAMGISEEYGGYVPITVSVIAITGIFGNICAESICKIFKITNPVAIGIAIGTSSHAAGTSKAMEIGEIEGAMSSLSIVITGICTLILVSIFQGFI